MTVDDLVIEFLGVCLDVGTRFIRIVIGILEAGADAGIDLPDGLLAEGAFGKNATEWIYYVQEKMAL